MSGDIEDIPDGCNLLRRVTPRQIVPDSNLGLGKRRLSSGAFRDRNMSVDAECLLVGAGLDWTFSLKGHADFFLVRFSAEFARRQGQKVQHSPLPGNSFHAEVIGSKSQPICNAFRLAAEWVKKPDDV